jgi:hypothetical protein
MNQVLMWMSSEINLRSFSNLSLTEQRLIWSNLALQIFYIMHSEVLTSQRSSRSLSYQNVPVRIRCRQISRSDSFLDIPEDSLAIPDDLRDLWEVLASNQKLRDLTWEDIPNEIQAALPGLRLFDVSHESHSSFLRYFERRFLCGLSNSLYIESQFSVVSYVDSVNMSDATKTARHKIHVNTLHKNRQSGTFPSLTYLVHASPNPNFKLGEKFRITHQTTRQILKRVIDEVHRLSDAEPSAKEVIQDSRAESELDFITKKTEAARPSLRRQVDIEARVSTLKLPRRTKLIFSISISLKIITLRQTQEEEIPS